MLQFRVRLQIAEALSSINQWYCSEAYGRKIDDPKTLMTYYIQSGGAANFAERYDQAMGLVNRWYCSECHRCDVRDPQILWDYYMKNVPVREKRRAV